jgi:hypothetical protein
MNSCGSLSRWSIGALVQPAKQPSCRLSNAFRLQVLSMSAVHGVNSNQGAGECPSKEFPKTEIMFPRMI